MKKTISALAALLVLSGCSSMFNIGESKLSGPVPQGFACADGMDALALTDDYQNGDNLDYNFCKGKKGKGVMEKPSHKRGVSPFNGETLPYVAPLDEPKPVLMPAQVMRVWVNAYENEEGSLVYPGRIFTEVTPRRWNVGYSARQNIDSNRTMSPLTIKRNDDNTPVKEAETEEGAEEAASQVSSAAVSAGPNSLDLNALQAKDVQPPGAPKQEIQNPLPPLQ